ncbi:MAG: hypothetical protein ACRDA0_00185 [Cetobacterium sp.]|uniref:hypothetical protein n=1 Tax=Cetobacterium sp. TaxID=2071632 RepID=UPI003F2B8391
MEQYKNTELLTFNEKDRKYSIKIFRTYYPKRYDIDLGDKKIRDEIYRFKDGVSFDDFLVELQEWLIEEYGKYELEGLIFLPIPASNREINEKRYKNFCDILCENLEIENGYNYVSIKENHRPNHLENNKKIKRYDFLSKCPEKTSP